MPPEPGRVAEPSPFFRAFEPEIARGRGPALDLACGRGRHTLATARLGRFAVGIDRDADGLAELERHRRLERLPGAAVRSDLETPRGICFESGSFGLILVFRFLFRPLAPEIVRLLGPGGLLLYETFTIHQKEFGYGPRNEAFLLRDGELLELFASLGVLEHWQGTTPGDRPEALARLAARRRP
jgi:SAM-dependent methyltransferase